jgi:diketogulonate reductase-like aldo/keto reductase
MSAQKFTKLNSGYQIPSVGLGTWLLSQSIAADVVYDALNAGYRHFDTAIYYKNEREVGEGIAKWLNEDSSRKREDVFYTSKLWTFDTYARAKQEIKTALDAVEDSLGYIDLLLLHSPMGGPQARRDAWKALQEAVDTGKVKSIGISSWGQHHIEDLYSWSGFKIEPAVNQMEVHPWCMRQELSNFCKRKGIMIQAYSPLAHGEKLDDGIVRELAQKYSVTPAQVLIRWNLQKGNIVLPKSSNAERLRSNLDVFSFELTDEEVAKISHPDVHEPTDWECTNMP